jgi:ribosome biogenesis protein YTM1
MDADASRQVRVRFVTKLPPPLRAPPTAIAVPAELSRMGLSEIVNKLIVSGERIRTLTLAPLRRDVPGSF